MSLTGLAFLICFVAGCVLAFARHPVYGLLTYVGVFYLHPPSRWWGESLPDFRWSLLAAAVAMIAVLLHRRTDASVPLLRHRVMIGLMLFVAWIALQTLWAITADDHLELVVAYAKYLLLVVLIYQCIDSVEHLKMVLWAHVLGCVYLGWLVLERYLGGRFEGFGGPDINEANSAALQIVTGIAAAGALFLAGRWKERAALLACIPLVVNALVATISRSGFVALAVTGVIFNWLSPRKFRGLVRVSSVLAVVLFLLLTNPVYWTRVGSIAHLGEEVEGVDTGAGRLMIIQVQWEMFLAHPMGCGHRCTATLSPYYLDDRYLTGEGENRARSSHNTFMTMLVEHGVPGAIFYLAMLAWVVRRIRALRRDLKGKADFVTAMYPAVAASLGAIFLGDLFVDYLKLEVRLWFIALLMILVKLNDVARDGRAHQHGRVTATAARQRIPASRYPDRIGQRDA